MFAAVRNLTILFSVAALACAQTPAGTSHAGGFDNPWEIAPVLQEISAHASRLLPLLDKVDVKSWVEKGASDTYIAQLQSSREQANALATEAKALAANPERLSAALQVFFRMQGLETMLNSLNEGVRNYQNPAAAQALAAFAAQNGANRERFQQYIVNLAAEREQDLQVMDREAQRCREMITQPPPKAGRKK